MLTFCWTCLRFTKCSMREEDPVGFFQQSAPRLGHPGSNVGSNWVFFRHDLSPQKWKELLSPLAP